MSAICASLNTQTHQDYSGQGLSIAQHVRASDCLSSWEEGNPAIRHEQHTPVMPSAGLHSPQLGQQAEHYRATRAARQYSAQGKG